MGLASSWFKGGKTVTKVEERGRGWAKTISTWSTEGFIMTSTRIGIYSKRVEKMKVLGNMKGRIRKSSYFKSLTPVIVKLTVRKSIQSNGGGGHLRPWGS